VNAKIGQGLMPPRKFESSSVAAPTVAATAPTMTKRIQTPKPRDE
jgi:hypothetical protein